MNRFKNAQVGDNVYCRRKGYGTIKAITEELYCIFVAFDGFSEAYTVDGKFHKDDFEPILFYVDGDNIYATERPKCYIKASLVPTDTKVYVWKSLPTHRSNRHFLNDKSGLLKTFTNGLSSFTKGLGITEVVWLNCELAEDITVLNVIYPAGTKVIEGKQ